MADDPPLASHRTWPAQVAEAAGRLMCHRPARAGSRGSWPPRHLLPGFCAAIVLAGLAGAPPAVIRRGGAPGEGWPSAPRQQPAGPGQAATLPLATVARHPGSLQPGITPGCEARLAGLARAPAGAYHCPCTSRVPVVDLSWTWPRNCRPAADLTPPAAGSPGPRPGPGRCPPGPGHCQVHERSMPGRRKVCRRAARGLPEVHARSMVAGCMGFRTPSRYP
jgi:hypothetical protein